MSNFSRLNQRWLTKTKCHLSGHQDTARTGRRELHEYIDVHLLSCGRSSSGVEKSPGFLGLTTMPTCGGDYSNGNLLWAAGDGLGVFQRPARMPEVVIVPEKAPHGARPKSCHRFRQFFARARIHASLEDHRSHAQDANVKHSRSP